MSVRVLWTSIDAVIESLGEIIYGSGDIKIETKLGKNQLLAAFCFDNRRFVLITFCLQFQISSFLNVQEKLRSMACSSIEKVFHLRRTESIFQIESVFQSRNYFQALRSSLRQLKDAEVPETDTNEVAVSNQQTSETSAKGFFKCFQINFQKPLTGKPLTKNSKKFKSRKYTFKNTTIGRKLAHEALGACLNLQRNITPAAFQFVEMYFLDKRNKNKQTLKLFRHI